MKTKTFSFVEQKFKIKPECLQHPLTQPQFINEPVVVSTGKMQNKKTFQKGKRNDLFFSGEYMNNNFKNIIFCLFFSLIILSMVAIQEKNVSAENGYYETTLVNNSEINFGKISVSKKIRKEIYDSMDEKPRFIITLNGETQDGEPYLRRKILSFENYDESNTEEYNDEAEYVFLYAEFDDLDLGTYQLFEEDSNDFILDGIEAIEGGTLKTTQEGKPYVEFVLTRDNTDGEFSSTFNNIPNNGSLKVIKYKDNAKTPLPGVTFRLTSDANDSFDPIEITTDENGIAMFEDVPAGEYALTEISTPKGYNLMKNQVKITIPMELDEEVVEAANVDTSNAIHSASRGKYIFYDITYEITNSPTLTMPFTGGISKTMQYFLLMSGFISVFAGIIYRRKNFLKTQGGNM